MCPCMYIVYPYESSHTFNIHVQIIHRFDYNFRQEMEEIKREILSLSEKYSVKCVESAALEERLATATAQLAQAHNHIMQLDSR